MSFWVYKKYLEWELGLVLQEFSRNYVQLVNYIDSSVEVLSLVMWKWFNVGFVSRTEQPFRKQNKLFLAAS